MDQFTIDKLKADLEPLIKAILLSAVDGVVFPQLEKLVADSANKIDDMILAAFEQSAKDGLHAAIAALKL